MSKPISPCDVTKAKLANIPDLVVEAINELISEKFNSRIGISAVCQDDIIVRIMAKMPGATRDLIFEKGWLDIEDMYGEAGWEVEYDKPGYNESYPATFRFKRPK